jgi:hypothetical protein
MLLRQGGNTLKSISDHGCMRYLLSRKMTLLSPLELTPIVLLLETEVYFTSYLAYIMVWAPWMMSPL